MLLPEIEPRIGYLDVLPQGLYYFNYFFQTKAVTEVSDQPQSYPATSLVTQHTRTSSLSMLF